MSQKSSKITCSKNAFGDVIYTNADNELHREDGPAYIWLSGQKGWYRNGLCHREDGPAIEHADGGKQWWVNNKLHREDGPAVEWVSGRVEYWLNGKPWPEGPQVIAEREERKRKDAALDHMKGVFNGTIPVETTVISRLKIKKHPPQP